MTRCRNNAADVAAISRCGRGDARAIEELYETYAGSCLALARSVLGDPGDAQNTVREAFLDLWRKAAGFDPSQSSVRGWLHLLTHRKAVDRVRSGQGGKAVALRSGDEGEEERHRPATQAAGAMLPAPTRQALAALPAAHREALVLAYWGGYSQREISALTSTPLGTVKRRMHTAMNDLRMILCDESPAEHRVARGARPAEH